MSKPAPKEKKPKVAPAFPPKKKASGRKPQMTSDGYMP